VEDGVSESPRAYLPIDFAPEKAKVNNRTCAADGCMRGTNDGKDYCRKHVHLMPYVVALLGAKPVKPARYFWVDCVDCQTKFRNKKKQAKRCPPCKKVHLARYKAAEKARRRERKAS
jgi:hypothetical protein